MTSTTSGAPQSGNAQGNDAQQQAASGQAPKGAPKQEPMIVPRHGKNITVPPEKIPDLVAKGLDYEINNQELKRDSRQFAEFQEFRSRVQNSPALQEVLAQALQNPEGVLTRIKTQPRDNGGDDGDDDDEPKPQRGSRGEDGLTAQERRALEQRIERLENENDRVRISSVMENEIKTYPWLADNPKAAAFVREHVTTQIEAGSRDPIAVLVGSGAGSVREMLVAADEARVKRDDESRKMRTASPSRGTPTLTPPPKMNSGAIRDGTFREAALKRAREWGLSD